jgi:hypothetical protein
LNSYASELHEGARSRAGLQLHCRGTHLQKKEGNHIRSAGSKADQELERLTFHGFPKVFDLFKKELFGVYGPRSFGESNVDLGGDNLQFLLRTAKLIA